MKVGDKVICIPLNRKGEGGAGYIEGKIFTIGRITNSFFSSDVILWSDDCSPRGIYKSATMLYTDRKSRINNLNL